MMIVSEKYEHLQEINWRPLKSKHITYSVACINGKSILAHRYIAALEGWDLEGKVIDHINGDGSDNRLENLQVVTQSQNMMKQRKPAGCTSNYKGVCAFRDKWRSRITLKGKTKSLGVYLSELESAYAYNKAAVKHFGDMAVLNPIGV